MALVAALGIGPLVLQDGGAQARVPVTGTPPAEVPDGVGDVAHLEPQVRSAVERALVAATADGVELRVTSGWRSAEHQQQLYDAAVAKYGSAAAARRWVLPPAESEHVQGRAVDVGPTRGASWLGSHGEQFGLCRRYDNEPWHFERLAGAVGSTCPPRQPYA